MTSASRTFPHVLHFFLIHFLFTSLVATQQIWDIWQTTCDGSLLFTAIRPPAPINFVTPGVIGEADVSVDASANYQTMLGFGATLTDSSAMTLDKLKKLSPSNYWSVLQAMFSPDNAGLNYIRLPIGASDFSENVYSFNDVSGDVSMSRFNMSQLPSYTTSVLRDMQHVNGHMKVHLAAWSPPGWMKGSQSMNGGSMLPQYIDAYALYLLKSIQGFLVLGFPIHAISIQNEPQHSNPTYPTCLMTPDIEARISIRLRAILDSNGVEGIEIIGYDHNWNKAGSYPVELINQAGDAVAGVAFHCYKGSVSGQDAFKRRFPNKDVYFTECTGTYGSDWWSDVKWYMDNLWIGSIERSSRTGLMWNIALDDLGGPKLPGTTSCAYPGCRPLVTVLNNGSYSFNQEFYAMAQASKAVTPKDPKGPFGQRIGVSVKGGKGWGLRATSFVTRRNGHGDWARYSLVVMNWDDGGGSGWNPKPIRTTINFRGLQATYTFPVGVTTLWWFAAV